MPQSPDPPASAPSPRRREHFPLTRRTWIEDRLAAGEFETLNEHIMSVYFEPLQIYFRASSARSIGEAPDVVAGFFADRLRRQEYLASWDPGQRPLRQFLINGFWLYLREKLGRRKRRGRVAELSDHFPDLAEASHESPERQFDRAWVRQVVRRAMDDASEICAERGLEDHWKIFRRHLFEHEPYTTLAEEYGIAPERAAVMCRTATRRFVESLHQLLARDGSPAAAQQVQELLEIIQ
jgi:hypothetical protein